MLSPPLQVIDNFLLQYNVGDALLFLFVLGLLATLPLKSRKVTTLHVISFGALFLLLPGSLMEVSENGSFLLGGIFQYKLVGLFLVVIGPVIYTTGSR